MAASYILPISCLYWSCWSCWRVNLAASVLICPQYAWLKDLHGILMLLYQDDLGMHWYYIYIYIYTWIYEICSKSTCPQPEQPHLIVPEKMGTSYKISTGRIVGSKIKSIAIISGKMHELWKLDPQNDPWYHVNSIVPKKMPKKWLNGVKNVP